MSISDSRFKRRRVRRTLAAYAGATLFCGVFSGVYEHFGHGVYSNYMVCLFLFPLVGGVLAYGAVGLADKLPFPGRGAYNLYNAGLATLALGSALRGALEIYGTSSRYMPVYWIAGGGLAGLGLLSYLLAPALRASGGAHRKGGRGGTI